MKVSCGWVSRAEVISAAYHCRIRRCQKFRLRRVAQFSGVKPSFFQSSPGMCESCGLEVLLIVPTVSMSFSICQALSRASVVFDFIPASTLKISVQNLVSRIDAYQWRAWCSAVVR